MYEICLNVPNEPYYFFVFLLKASFMKIYGSILPLMWLITLASCDQNTSSCKQITIDKPFIARIDERWCIDDAGWKVTFGPFIEDSRCNVDGIDCVWAGRFVMGATFEKGETKLDTFYAVHNWSDTLYHSQYRIILEKIYPETRASMEPLDPTEYSFKVIVSQE